MVQLWFVATSIAYIVSLSIVDGVFNRLVFRNYSNLPYKSPQKRKIYQLPEWRTIGLILLVVLPIVVPTIVSYSLGGLPYLLTYFAILCLVQWDVIFGKIVFGNWLSDTPSIALPFIGWLHFPLKFVILVRLVVAFILLYTVTNL